MDIPKTYNSKEHEDRIYKEWEEGGFFNPDENIKRGSTPADAPSFTIMMPPPNVTGVLHLGHALENSLMDIMCRFQRMRGKRALLVPGTDHAAVATQARVEKDLKEKGIEDPRKEYGREKLVEMIREYADKQQSTILSQIRKMGTSCDWTRLAYTFDEQRSRAVNAVFEKMYNDGLIYRGYRPVNWSVVGQCTHSDGELIHVERDAKLYTFTYSKDFPIPIATTRPETKLGDTAVAVHPDDERYKQYIGKIFEADFGAKAPLQIRIVGDYEVDPQFGTGAVGVTPAHSMVDFAMKKRHDLELVCVIGSDGKMTQEAGPDYAGLTVEEARTKVVDRLRREGLLIKEEDITQNVGTSERFGDVIEVLPLLQWFVDVEKEIPGRGKSLNQLQKESITTGLGGNQDQKITITPDRFEKIYTYWIEHPEAWCISRQIWWGHRIPVWYCKNKDCDPIVSIGNTPESCPKCAATQLQQDPDTLDTWFSSALWTFSTLGWPQNSKDLETYHPTSWIQMGYEIYGLWMARMILMTTYMLDEIPFKNVYFHGLVRAKDGRKFSKSLRNSVDPLEMIEKYGTDALRMSLLMGVTPGNDLKFYEEKVEHYQHFVNKLWNISRYILTTVDNGRGMPWHAPTPKTPWDTWILSRLSEVVREATEGIEKYEFARVGELLYDFTWRDFADWYIEVAKIEGEKDEILLYVLQTLLKLWHPYMPFVTERIWEYFNAPQKLIVTEWPTSGIRNQKSGIQEVEVMKEVIAKIREARASFHIPPSQLVNLCVKEKSKLQYHEEVLKRLARVEEIQEVSERPLQSITVIVGGGEMFLPVGDFLDIEKETARLKSEIENVENYTMGLAGKLQNESFLKNAKPEIIEETRKKKEDADAKLALLKNQLEQIS